MSKPKDKQPWFKFYPQDWRGDEELRACSIGARGLWVEMLCVMHKAEPYGHLLINGKQVLPRQMAKLAGISDSEYMKYILELESAGVYSRTENRTIYSRRMVRDGERTSKAREWGKAGGNPKIKAQVDHEVKEGVNPPDKGKDKPHIPEARVAVAEDVREPIVSDAARDLADELLELAGHSVQFVPPGWCGAAMRVHAWLASGWTRDVIRAGAKAAIARNRGGRAINSVQFFEGAIADEVARQAAPLPTVEIRQAEQRTVKIDVRSQANGNVIQAADRLLDTVRNFDAMPGAGDIERLRGAAGAAAPRLLSQG